MRLFAVGFGAVLASAAAAQTLGLLIQASPPISTSNFVRESAAGDYFIGGMLRYSSVGEPLFSQPANGQTVPREVCFLANGDYATTGGGDVIIRRPDGTIRLTIDIGSSSVQTYKVTEVGTSIVVLYRSNQTAIMAKYSRYGVEEWDVVTVPVSFNNAHDDPRSILFEATAAGIVIAGPKTTGYVVARIDPADGSIDARVDSALAATATRFARNGDTVGVLQRRGTEVDVAAFDTNVTGTIPELWRVSPPNPYPGATGAARPAIAPASGSGFVYTYQDKVDDTQISKQIVQELALNGSPVWTVVTDSPNVNEDLVYRAIVADGTYAYATGSIKSKAGAILYDRFLLSVWRRSDGEEVGWVEQGHHSPLLSGSDIVVNNKGVIGVALVHTTNQNPRYMFATYHFAAPIGVTGLSLGRTVLAGQNRTLGTVTVDRPAIIGGVDVELSSTSGNVMVPANITVPEGSATQTFTVSTLPVAAVTVETITAQTDTSLVTTSITLVPLAPSAFAFTPSPVTGGSTVSARLVINGVAPAGGLTVNLSDDNAFAVTPASVVVPAGAPQVVFDITTLPVVATQFVTVTATTPGGIKTGLFVISP